MMEVWAQSPRVRFWAQTVVGVQGAKAPPPPPAPKVEYFYIAEPHKSVSHMKF